MTTEAACTVRTQYGSGGSSGNGSGTGHPVESPPPATARLRGRFLAELLLRSDLPFLPPGTAGKAVQGAAGKGTNAAGAGARKLPSQFKNRHEGKGP